MTPKDYDPTFVNTRREAKAIFAAWVVALLWAVPCCYLLGYNRTPDEITTVLGIPSWVFWGVLAPWLVADAFTIWFCAFVMVDDDLGEESTTEPEA